MSAVSLIALDWGTSNLRASLLGPGGVVLDRRSAAGGVMAVPERRFEAALRALCGDWIDAHRCPLIASGMIGSRQGWVEAPYLPCPATLQDAATRLVAVPLHGAVLHIVPGLIADGRDGQADVMRGEETQLWGAGLAPGEVCVLPGTHSKWAWMGAGGAVERFQTHMTGELYAVLVQHSILGRLMPGGPAAPHAAAFADGVRLGQTGHAQLTHALFAVRTAGLTGRQPATALPDFLSGLLIGAEIAGACADGAPAAVTLLGEVALCERYAGALALAGIDARHAPAEATTRGQWRLAQAAGLVREAA
jgi:2-dehydro-3-deoxygalactonokinase